MKQLIYPVILGMVLTAAIPAFGQRVDSLKQALDKAGNPAVKMAIQKELIDSLWEQDKELAKQYLEALLGAATKARSYEYLAYGMERTAGLSYYAGQLDSARAQYNRAYGHYLKAKDKNKASKAFARVGVMHSLQGNYTEAEKIYRHALRSAAGLPDALAFIHNQMGTLYHYQSQVDSAGYYYDKSVEAYTRLEDTIGLLRPMYNHAVLLMENGNSSAATEKLLRIKSIQERKRAYTDLILTLQSLSNLSIQAGDLHQALEYTRMAYRYSEEINNQFYKISILQSLAKISFDLKDSKSCFTYLAEARSIAEAAGASDNLLSTLYNIGETYIQLGQYDRAITTFEEALEIIKKVANSRIKPNILVALGQAYSKIDRFAEARRVLNEAIELSKGVDQADPIYDAYSILAEISLNEKKPAEAVRYALLAYDGNVQLDSQLGRMENAKTLSQAYKQLGQYEPALKYHEVFKTLSDSINDTEKVRELTIETKDLAFKLEKQQLELEQQKREVLLRAAARQNLIIAGSIGALALLGFGFFWNSRRKNQLISHKNLQLEQLNLTKDRIFAIIGHDLRKPALAFRGIASKVNYLLKKQDFTTLNALGAQIEQDAYALNQLTDNLLSWALSQKNVLPHNPVMLPLAEEVAEVLTIFTAAALEKQVEINTDIPADLAVYADQNALRAIIRNLVDNALKYTHAGGKVTITATNVPEGVTLQVADTGVGMPEEKLRDIFLLQKEKSERGTTGEKGVGLGLHLVYELVKMNQGAIQAFSRVGEGTRFAVLLPHLQS